MVGKEFGVARGAPRTSGGADWPGGQRWGAGEWAESPDGRRRGWSRWAGLEAPPSGTLGPVHLVDVTAARGCRVLVPAPWWHLSEVVLGASVSQHSVSHTAN